MKEDLLPLIPREELTDAQVNILNRSVPGWEGIYDARTQIIARFNFFLGRFAPNDATRAADAVTRQLRAIEKYMAVLGSRGWAFSGRVAGPHIQNAMDTYESTGDAAAAERLLTGLIAVDGDGMRNALLPMTLLRGSSTDIEAAIGKRRMEIVEAAIQHHLAGSYEASVPIFLAQAEGVAQDAFGQAAFVRDGRLEKFATENSIFGDPAYLRDVLDSFTKTIDVSSLEDSPSRHGILHGRILGYDTARTSAKAFLLLAGFVELAARRQDANIQQEIEAEHEANAGSREFKDNGERPVDMRGFADAKSTLMSIWGSCQSLGYTRVRVDRSVRLLLGKTRIVEQEPLPCGWSVILRIGASGLYLGIAAVGESIDLAEAAWSYMGFDRPVEFSAEDPGPGWHKANERRWLWHDES